MPKIIFLLLFSFLFTSVFAQEIAAQKLTWEEKLDYAKEGGYENILKDIGLTLVKYQLNEVLSPELVQEKEIDSTTVLVIPQAPESGYDVKFIVGTYSDKEVINKLNEDRSKVLSLYKNKQLSVVDLYWEYKGKFYVTHCLVDEGSNEIVYDDFISFIFVVTKEEVHKLTEGNSL